MMYKFTLHSPFNVCIPAAKKYVALMLTLLLLGSIQTKAQYITVPVTGFTADVIANGNTFPASVTADVDSLSYYFLDSSFTALGSPNYGALPTSGTIHSAATPGLVFQLASASANNSLRLSAGKPTGALRFTTPAAASTVYVLATSGNLASTLNVNVVFTDSTSQAFNSQTVSDWFDGANYAIWGVGRVVGRITPPQLDSDPGTVNNHDPRIYQLALSLSSANYNKPIAYISFTKISTTPSDVHSIAHLMGISILPTLAPCAAPTNQPTTLVFSGITTSSMSVSFTAATSSPSGYLVVRYPNGATPVAPTNGTTYTAGGSLGTGTIESVGTATSFTSTSLSLGTTYTYYVYDYYNSTSCSGGPVYNTTSPLTASQSTVACTGTLSGIIPVGPTAPASPSGFATLTAAATYINTNGLGGKTTLELQSDYTSTSETFPITFSSTPCITAAKSLGIRPAASATGLVISGNNAGATIDLNGAKYITIDGRPGGNGSTKQLSIVNTNTAGVAIRFINDASYNKLTYCDIKGENASSTSTALSGVVYFGTAFDSTTNGNDNDTLSYCDIHAVDANSAIPVMNIVAAGTPTRVAAYNDRSVITNCNIYDFYHISNPSAGIKLDAGNNAWSITNNSIYQTVTRTYGPYNPRHRGIWVAPNTSSIDSTASGFTITGNSIGGSAPLATGTAYTMNTTPLVSTTSLASFSGIETSVGLGSTTAIESNTITNISFTTGNSASTSFIGISMNNGNIDCGSAGGNLIGSATSAGVIQYINNNSTASQNGLMGIQVDVLSGSSSNIVINNNTIGGITLSGTSSTYSPSFAGIQVADAGSTNVSMNGNTIGSATLSNSINMISGYTGSTATPTMSGIWIAGGKTITMTGNLIANLNTMYAGTGNFAGLDGILVNAPSPKLVTIAGNTIRNLATASNSVNTGAYRALTGICISTGADSIYRVTGNTIHTLYLTGNATTSAVGSCGIYMSTASTRNMVSGNFIHSFGLSAANNSAVITGIDINGGHASFFNNMIRLGVDATGAGITTGVQFRGIVEEAGSAGYYFNSVYIGGTGVTGTQNSFAFGRTAPSASGDSVINNIFANTRSNATGSGNTGKHYAVSFTGTNATSSLLADHNLYYANGVNGFFALNGTTDIATYTASWIASDVNSVTGDPKFKTPTGTSATVDLHISATASSPATHAAARLTTIITDFDGNARSTTPDIGADEFSNPLPVVLVDFQGQKQGNANVLSWQTATEINSKGFELQRGVDGNTFSTLSFISSKAANGNSSSLLNYQSTDVQPLSGDNYYRLKLVDKDGSFAYSNIVLLKGTQDNAVVAIYPNPVTDKLNVMISSKENNKVSLTISSMNGQVLYSQSAQLVTGSNLLQVNASLLAKGAYAIKIVAADGSIIHTSLFVK